MTQNSKQDAGAREGLLLRQAHHSQSKAVSTPRPPAAHHAGNALVTSLPQHVPRLIRGISTPGEISIVGVTGAAAAAAAAAVNTNMPLIGQRAAAARPAPRHRAAPESKGAQCLARLRLARLHVCVWMQGLDLSSRCG